ALLEFFAGMRGAVHVAFEEGTQAQWLHDLLFKRVARVVVCDRRGTPKHGNKGDQVDSALLSDSSILRIKMPQALRQHSTVGCATRASSSRLECARHRRPAPNQGN
ncbi:MAG TPA: hypothetical protein VF006_16535, partial [Longimicrobium sp.]